MDFHVLKTWPMSFEGIWIGAKLFDLRKLDRPFKLNDVLHLQEFKPDQDPAESDPSGVTGTYTGRELLVQVTCILKQFAGLESGYGILGIKILTKTEK